MNDPKEVDIAYKASAPQAIDGGVGRERPHDSGSKHVAGEATYVDDIPEPLGLLHVHIAQAQIAHATISKLDLTKVRSAPGVVAVMMAQDIPGHNDVSPIVGDDPMFADREIEYWGQSIFAVAAETLDAARRAARLAVVEYDAKPPIISIDDAMEARSFLEEPFTMACGDAAQAIASAPHVVTGRMYIGGQEHFYLEGQAAFAVPGEDEDITVHSSTQHPTEIQHKVAHVLGIANHAVTIEVRRMGGAFGGKESQGNLPACAAASTLR